MNEKWRDIEDYEGLYQVSNLGRIKSLDRVVICRNGTKIKIRERILKQNKVTKGYLQVSLNNKKTEMARVHRIVAKAFIDNRENKKEVNHINGIKTDNRVENLEWNTSLENKRHAVKHNLTKVSCFRATDKKGKMVLTKNLSKFARNNNLDAGCISKCLNKKRKTHKGWRFEYAT